MKLLILAFVGIVVGLQLVKNAEGHGKLMNPPSRSSIWRFPEFAHLNPVPNYSDNELFCGGVGVSVFCIDLLSFCNLQLENLNLPI